MSVLQDLASFIDNHTKYGKLYNFTQMVQEFEKSLIKELDFRNEAENAETIQSKFCQGQRR